MKKHAYLIMAYNNPHQLIKLMEVLDDPRNDLFIHIDADSSDFPMESLLGVTKRAGCTLVDRVSVKWASYAEMEAEYILLRAATEAGHYHYYHLLSGQDFPIKTQDEIHEFFEDQTDEFIATVSTEGCYQLRLVKYHYPLLGLKTFRKHKSLKALAEGLVLLQKMVGVNKIRRDKDWHFYDGWQWFSVTDTFARYLLTQLPRVDRIFKTAKASSEMVLQTVAMNSPFKERIHSLSDLQEGCMRRIDWERGKPYIFQEEDFDELINSPYLFARKLDENMGGVLLDMMYNHVMKSQEEDTLI